MSGVGVDAFHALQMAQAMIHVELVTSAEYKRGSLYWLDPDDDRDDLGFPDSVPTARLAKRKRPNRRAERRVGPKDGHIRRRRPNEG